MDEILDDDLIDLSTRVIILLTVGCLLIGAVFGLLRACKLSLRQQDVGQLGLGVNFVTVYGMFSFITQLQYTVVLSDLWYLNPSLQLLPASLLRLGSRLRWSVGIVPRARSEINAIGSLDVFSTDSSTSAQNATFNTESIFNSTSPCSSSFDTPAASWWIGTLLYAAVVLLGAVIGRLVFLMIISRANVAATKAVRKERELLERREATGFRADDGLWLQKCGKCGMCWEMSNAAYSELHTATCGGPVIKDTLTDGDTVVTSTENDGATDGDSEPAWTQMSASEYQKQHDLHLHGEHADKTANPNHALTPQWSLRLFPLILLGLSETSVRLLRFDKSECVGVATTAALVLGTLFVVVCIVAVVILWLGVARDRRAVFCVLPIQNNVWWGGGHQGNAPFATDGLLCPSFWRLRTTGWWRHYEACDEMEVDISDQSSESGASDTNTIPNKTKDHHSAPSSRSQSGVYVLPDDDDGDDDDGIKLREPDGQGQGKGDDSANSHPQRDWGLSSIPQELTSRSAKPLSPNNLQQQNTVATGEETLLADAMPTSGERQQNAESLQSDFGSRSSRADAQLAASRRQERHIVLGAESFGSWAAMTEGVIGEYGGGGRYHYWVVDSLRRIAIGMAISAPRSWSSVTDTRRQQSVCLLLLFELMHLISIRPYKDQIRNVFEIWGSISRTAMAVIPLAIANGYVDAVFAEPVLWLHLGVLALHALVIAMGAVICIFGVVMIYQVELKSKSTQQDKNISDLSALGWNTDDANVEHDDVDSRLDNVLPPILEDSENHAPRSDGDETPASQTSRVVQFALPGHGDGHGDGSVPEDVKRPPYSPLQNVLQNQEAIDRTENGENDTVSHGVRREDGNDSNDRDETNVKSLLKFQGIGLARDPPSEQFARNMVVAEEFQRAINRPVSAQTRSRPTSAMLSPRKSPKLEEYRKGGLTIDERVERVRMERQRFTDAQSEVDEQDEALLDEFGAFLLGAGLDAKEVMPVAMALDRSGITVKALRLWKNPVELFIAVGLSAVHSAMLATAIEGTDIGDSSISRTTGKNSEEQPSASAEIRKGRMARENLFRSMAARGDAVFAPRARAEIDPLTHELAVKVDTTDENEDDQSAQDDIYGIIHDSDGGGNEEDDRDTFHDNVIRSPSPPPTDTEWRPERVLRDVAMAIGVEPHERDLMWVARSAMEDLSKYRTLVERSREKTSSPPRRLNMNASPSRPTSASPSRPTSASPSLSTRKGWGLNNRPLSGKPRSRPQTATMGSTGRNWHQANDIPGSVTQGGSLGPYGEDNNADMAIGQASKRTRARPTSAMTLSDLQRSRRTTGSDAGSRFSIGGGATKYHPDGRPMTPPGRPRPSYRTPQEVQLKPVNSPMMTRADLDSNNRNTAGPGGAASSRSWTPSNMALPTSARPNHTTSPAKRPQTASPSMSMQSRYSLKEPNTRLQQPPQPPGRGGHPVTINPSGQPIVRPSTVTRDRPKVITVDET